MKLGLGMGYWSAGPPADMLDTVLEAERLGFDSMWTAEAYGSDALTPVAWFGAHTSRLKLGTGICQMPARTPTALGMAAMTLDHLSEGRLLLGVGASGPQVVEGWYGQPYPKPLGRTREYVDIVRKTVARAEPVTYSGDHYTLPYPGGAGLGKALKSTIHPRRPEIPIYLGAEGPKNIARGANFHFEAIARAGFEAEATKIQELYLAGNKKDAIAAVPTAMVEAMALVGPPEKIRDDLAEWEAGVVTTLLVSGPPVLLRALAEIAL